jgi:hypothetical protein
MQPDTVTSVLACADIGKMRTCPLTVVVASKVSSMQTWPAKAIAAAHVSPTMSQPPREESTGNTGIRPTPVLAAPRMEKANSPKARVTAMIRTELDMRTSNPPPNMNSPTRPGPALACTVILLSFLISGCSAKIEISNPPPQLEGILVNQSEKQAEFWLNISQEEQGGRPLRIASWNGSLAASTSWKNAAPFVATGIVHVELRWAMDGERIEFMNQPVFEDAFTYGVKFSINASRCEQGEKFLLNSTVNYTQSAPQPATPLLYHGIEGRTKWNGCQSSGSA